MISRPFNTQRSPPSGHNPGIDQATLAGLIAYDRTTITGVVDRLVQKGLLVRQASRTDRRARELQITDEGQRTLDGMSRPSRRRSGSCCAACTESRGRDAHAALAQGDRRRQRTKPRAAAGRGVAVR